MPTYTYKCEANGHRVDVVHDIDVALRNWGEVCYLAGVDPGDTDPGAGVERIIDRAPGIAVSTLDSELRNAGFTKLVRRDEGVYENVTAIDGEERFMIRGRNETLPHVHKKVGD